MRAPGPAQQGRLPRSVHWRVRARLPGRASIAAGNGQCGRTAKAAAAPAAGAPAERAARASLSTCGVEAAASDRLCQDGRGCRSPGVALADGGGRALPSTARAEPPRTSAAASRPSASTSPPRSQAATPSGPSARSAAASPRRPAPSPPASASAAGISAERQTALDLDMPCPNAGVVGTAGGPGGRCRADRSRAAALNR